MLVISEWPSATRPLRPTGNILPTWREMVGKKPPKGVGNAEHEVTHPVTPSLAGHSS